MYESLLRFPGDILGEFERLQRERSPSAIGPMRSRSGRWHRASTRAKLEVSIDRGLLTITGERSADVPAETDKVNVYAKERFAGAFKRVISVPEDVDPARVSAQYRDGVLRITANRREEAKPRRIEVQ
jgi:HSP20 family protein